MSQIRLIGLHASVILEDGMDGCGAATGCYSIYFHDETTGDCMGMELTYRDIAKFERRLKQREKDLKDEIFSDLTNTPDRIYADRILDSGEEAVADVTAYMKFAELRKEVVELAEVGAALRRIREGTFGICLDCAIEIDPRRLAIYPTAKRCTACQRRHEHQAKDTTPSL